MFHIKVVGFRDALLAILILTNNLGALLRHIKITLKIFNEFK